jgi:CheY-like chemotaxis protein
MASPVVLVIEDNAELRTVLRDALGAEGYQVLVARDETEAVEILRGGRVDLLISDLTDPVETPDGLEALRAEFPDLPVVALSPGGGSHPPFFFAAWQAPKGLRTLSKPFRLAELLAVSREVLGATG